MKKIFSFLATLLFAGSVLAGNYEVNSDEVLVTCAKDMPAMFYFTNVREGEAMQINCNDRHIDNGPDMRFTVKLYGDKANGETFSALSDGDASFYIPGSLVDENTVAVVFDENRFKFSDSTTGRDTWEPAQVGFQALQDVPAYPEIEVYTKDHHLGHPGIYVWSLYLKNIGTVDLVNPTVRYYFTVEDINTDITLFDYYTPKSTIQLLHVPGTKEYALEFKYDNITLQPGETTKGAVENQVQLYYAGYATIDKSNDFSNPIPKELFIYPNSTLFKINKKVAVFDTDEVLVEGEELPGHSRSEFVPVK